MGVPLTKAQGTTLRSMDLAQLRDGLWERDTHPSTRLDRNPGYMDRESARDRMRAGLVAGGIAAGIFALSFVAAFLYIAQ